MKKKPLKPEKPSVSAIVLTIAGQRIELSVEDAKTLHSQLGTLLGERTISIPSLPFERRNRKDDDEIPWPRWPQPPIICESAPKRERTGDIPQLTYSPRTMFARADSTAG